MMAKTNERAKNMTTKTKKAQAFAFDFIDNAAKRARLNATISEDGRFSISGECGGSSGQCLDGITPRPGAQTELIAVWREWHLNDMKAGTPEQERALDEWRAASGGEGYEKAVEYLKSRGLYEVMHDGAPYKYGSAWLTRELPKDFGARLRDIQKRIEAEEAARVRALNTPPPVCDDETGHAPEPTWGDLDDPKAAALGKFLEVTPGEAAAYITGDGNRYEYAGTDYLVCTDEEADEEARESMENYIDECVLHEIPEQYHWYFDTEKFCEDAINADGRGHILNRYDGEEGEAEHDGATYYIYRQ